MAKFILDPCVEDELWAIWEYIARENPAAATRVLEAAYETFKILAANPGRGRPRKLRNPKLNGIHSWHFSGFDNYLVFYRKVETGIQVLHVYHRARDIDSLFDNQ